MSHTLEQLARDAGIAVEWTDARGQPQRVAPDVLRAVLSALDLPCASPAQIDDSVRRLEAEASQPGQRGLVVGCQGRPFEVACCGSTDTLPWKLVLEDGRSMQGMAERSSGGQWRVPGIDVLGYHTLFLGDVVQRVAITPERCTTLADLAGRPHPRLWGVAAQMYALRREGGLGLSDFTALTHLAEAAAREGAAALAVSPLHAMFSADAQRYSPYSPSSRLFLNALYVDPFATFPAEAVHAALHDEGLGAWLAMQDKTDLVDWAHVAPMRLRLLRRLFGRLSTDLPAARIDELHAFRQEGGQTLEDHARFEAIQHDLYAEPDWIDRAGSWRTWPAELQDARSAAVEAFAVEHAEEVSFHVFLQWLAARGLGGAHAAARAAGMSVGLIADLAVGTDGGGSHTWSRQRETLIGLSVGAPPDIFNQRGQSWGLSAFSPRALQQTGFAPFLEMVQAALAHAGGMRADHVLGLKRLWLVPDGASPKDGAYLRYPFDDLLALLALESRRHGALIVGENLGTVPEGFNEQLTGMGALGTTVLFFERGQDHFRSPAHWPAHSMATTTTHDLPTVTGWWRERDIDWRERLELFDPHTDPSEERRHRREERRQLWKAFSEAGVAQGGMPEEAPVSEALAFVGSTPAPLVIAPLEDLCALVEQPNLPGTIDTHPNWRQRLPLTVETLFAAPGVAARIAALAAARQSAEAHAAPGDAS